MELLAVSSLEEAVTALFGAGTTVFGRQQVFGGDINRSFRVDLSCGSSVFMKCNSPKNLAFFEAEAKGLQALAGTGAIGVPKALAVGRDDAASFLLLEYLETGPKSAGYWETFGRELAALHRADPAGLTGSELPFGFAGDNFIGASPQKNTPKKTWIDFFRDCRLGPQLSMAERYFDRTLRRQGEKLLDRLDALLTEPAFPSLIHGDLWSGNALCGPDGKAWILDPAAYVGCFEAELAMTELFGAFPDGFYRAYHEENPIDPGYEDRRDIYNLYHLLNHLNLFGSSYLTAVQRILKRYGE